MKSERKLELVERWYWACLNPLHRHTKELAAVACIAKKPAARKWTETLVAQCRVRIASGESYAALGRSMGISGQAVKAAIDHFERSTQRRQRAPTGSIEALGLSVRSANCLLGEHIETVDALCRRTKVEISKIPNMGSFSLMEIIKALKTVGRELRG